MGDHASSEETVAAGVARVRTCFVIAPIGEEGSPIRLRSDQVLKHIIKKALEPDYHVERADEINRPGTISVQVVQRVFEADLVVADLTGRNANVFYELAIRHATKKPSVHIVATGEEIPFDINQIRAVKFDITNPDSIEDAQRRLQEQVKAIEGGDAVITPVQFAQILRSLESGESGDRQIFEVLQGLATGISSLKSEVGEMIHGLATYLVDELAAQDERPFTYMTAGRQFPGLARLGRPLSFRFPSAGAGASNRSTQVEAEKPLTATEEKQDKPKPGS